MGFQPLPTSIDEIDTQSWATFEPHFEALLADDATADPDVWLAQWSHLSKLFRESGAWLSIQRSLDTRDEAAEKAFMTFVRELVPAAQSADNKLMQRLLTTDVNVDSIDLLRRRIQNRVDLFREENLALQSELAVLGNEYDKLTGALSADWDGEEKNLSALNALLGSGDRAVAERAWHTLQGLWQSVRPQLNELFLKMLPIRDQIAKNAGHADYRAYIFLDKERFDYTPADSQVFHEAIETAVVPAVKRILDRKRDYLKLDALEPWDWMPEVHHTVIASDHGPLQPYSGQDDLVARCRAIFDNLDPVLGDYFATMADEELLDLDTRAGKALGGYCSTLTLRERPYIFMNGAGTHDNVQTMLHEAGHAFHAFATMANQPIYLQQRAPMEFCEVASMAMELLAAPYLNADQGGFYSASDAARAKIEHLESILLFWPYMAVVDAFQHWVYTHVDEIENADQLDAKWDELWVRFLGGVDWDGYESIRASGWHRKLHIFRVPFYYVEYGMAQVGAVQVWRNSLKDHAAALADYRSSLALGGTRTLPDLFEAAGAEFRFDADMLGTLVDLIENEIGVLETQIGA